MRTWHPKSYSQQARELADKFFEWEDKKDAFEILQHTYRAPIIAFRAAKRFGRKMREKNNDTKK